MIIISYEESFQILYKMVLNIADLPWFGQILQEDQRFPQWMEAPTKRGRGRRSNPWWKGMIKHVLNFEENYF